MEEAKLQENVHFPENSVFQKMYVSQKLSVEDVCFKEADC